MYWTRRRCKISGIIPDTHKHNIGILLIHLREKPYPANWDDVRKTLIGLAHTKEVYKEHTVCGNNSRSAIRDGTKIYEANWEVHRLVVTSSLNEISTDQLGNYSRVVVRVEVLLPPPPPQLLSTTGVNDTGDKFIAGIKFNDTGDH